MMDNHLILRNRILPKSSFSPDCYGQQQEKEAEEHVNHGAAESRSG